MATEPFPCTTIYVVRHAQTDWNAHNRLQGYLDIPLNAMRRQQAMDAQKNLSPIPFDICMTSDLQREVQRARILIAERPIECESKNN